MPSLKFIPRYTFAATGVGCGTHDDPECLCDVTLTDTNNTPVNNRIPHPHIAVALAELGDELPSARNIIELASVMLGAHDLSLRVEAQTEESPVRGGPPEWQALPVEERVALRHHYVVGTPWSIARHEIGGYANMSDADIGECRRYYTTSRSWNERARRNGRHQNRQMARAQIKTCQGCGSMMTNVSTLKKSCSETCRQKAYRNRKGVSNAI